MHMWQSRILLLHIIIDLNALYSAELLLKVELIYLVTASMKCYDPVS